MNYIAKQNLDADVSSIAAIFVIQLANILST